MAKLSPIMQQNGRWFIHLFGGLRVAPGASAAAGEGVPENGRIITRFSTQKTGALLAYLAYFRERAHPREVLIEMLWPGEKLQAGRHSLSMALSSLRHQLEPPGVPSGAVIVADRQNVGLNRDAVTTDVARFDADLQAAARTTGGAREKAMHLSGALARVSGPLLPGYYDEWVLIEQGQTQERVVRAATTLADLWEKEGDLVQAAQSARYAVDADPLSEKAQHTFLRLLLASGQAGEALRRGNAFAERLQDETGDAPGTELRNLLRRIERERQSPVVEARRTTEAGHAGLILPAAIRATPVLPDASPISAAPALPSGTVTFLLADFGPEGNGGSGNDFSRLRSVFQKEGGHDLCAASEKAASTKNLAFAFAAAGDALRAASLALENPQTGGEAAERSTRPARIALHTGDVQADGTNGAVNVDVLRRSEPALHAARLLDAGHTGQTFITEATVLLVRPNSLQALSGAQFADLGLFLLTPYSGDREKGAPERLFRVQFPHLTLADADMPPPRVEAAYQANLPLTFTRFFGREPEIAALTQRYQDPAARLVTLTGPGGMGKTRLSIQVAQRLADFFHGRVCFVPLAEVVSADAIADTIAMALKIAPSPQTTPVARIARHVGNERTLLVLDNFEQVATGGAVVVQELLEQIPGLRLLVTSRHLLHLDAEHEFAVGPLPTPASTIVRPDQLRLFESAQVFVDRAQAVRPDFQLTERNAPAIAALCERLEGLPLALELAASRAQVLAPAQMLAQLDNRLDFLVSRRAGHAARHRSLNAAIEWSVRLLDPALAAFFTRLAVFRGGWTWEAAETVCEEPLALDYLAQLRECSLVLAEETFGGEIRFRMLETLRDYAWAQLPSDQKPPLQEKHRDVFLQIAEAEHARLATAEQSLGLERLETEHNNLRAALDFALVSNGDAALLLRLVLSLTPFWMFRGYLREGAETIASALLRLENAPSADATQSGVRRTGRASLLSGAAEIAFTRGDLQTARAQMEACLTLRREIGEPRGIAIALNNLGNIASGLGDEGAARALYEESLALQRELHHTVGVARTLNNLGALVARAGDLGAAHSLFAESLLLRRQVGDSRGIAIALVNLGNILCDLNRKDEARPCYVECLTLCQRLGEKNGIAYALDGFADLARAENRAVDAARLYGAASALREKAEIRLPPSEQARHERGLKAAETALGKTAFASAFAAGQAHSWEEACQHALDETAA